MPHPGPYSGTLRAAGRFGIVGTYPPKLCGLATFAAALAGALRAMGNRVDVVRIDDGDGSSAPLGTISADLVNGSWRSVRNAAAVLSRCDVAVVQHEFGIYGGSDGDEVVGLMQALTVPSIVTLHTVPVRPTAHQKLVLEQVAQLADRIVVMSATAADRLDSLYEVDGAKVVTVPHGASAPVPTAWSAADRGTEPPELLTWGLLGPGKGIEHVIEALALIDPTVRPRYTVAGVTHPKVLAHFGDRYRQSLIARCHEVGVAPWVTFDDTYRTVAQLVRFVASASVVVLPYDSRDQVTSGVLVDAIAAGRPVISTAFPHARELLGSGAGIVVPHADPVALADAIRSVVTHPGVIDAMATEARRLAPKLSWATIASQYCDLADDSVAALERFAI